MHNDKQDYWDPPILSEFQDVLQPFNSSGIYDIVYETGTRENQSSFTGAWAFDNFNIKTWGKDFESLDEVFSERSRTWGSPL